MRSPASPTEPGSDRRAAESPPVGGTRRRPPARRGRLAGRLVAAVLLLLAGGAAAHDGTSYGGIYRTRDAGGSWLPVDVGLFLRAAVALAVDPAEPTHLLLGTDTGLLRTRNGGRQWTPVAGDLVAGPVTAVALAPGGTPALAVDPAGLYRFTEGRWRRVEVPTAALPARALEPGAAPGRFWLLGRARLFRSDDGGLSFARVADDLPTGARMTGLAVLRGPAERLLAVVDGRLLASDDGGRRWLGRSPTTTVDLVVADPFVPGRVWAAGEDRLWRSDDRGESFRPHGLPLPDPQTPVRGIAADPAGRILIVSSHRGLYRSEDGGRSWLAQEGNLPAHQESGPLLRDPTDPATLLVAYSLQAYAELWRDAVAAADRLARPEPLRFVFLAGGGAGALVGLALVARLLRRGRARPLEPVVGS